MRKPATKKTAKKASAKKAAEKKAPSKKLPSTEKRIRKATRQRSPVLQAHFDNIALSSAEQQVISKKYHDVEHDKIPDKVWALFLETLSETGNVTKTCHMIGLRRITVYKRYSRDTEFRAEMDEAHATGMKQLEDHALKRAIEGIDKPVFFQGDVVATVKEYSDSLLQFLLQGRDSRYKRKQEISGPDGGPLQVLMELTDDELDERLAKIESDLKEAKAG